MRNRHCADQVATELFELRWLRTFGEYGRYFTNGSKRLVDRVECLAEIGKRLGRRREEGAQRVKVGDELIETRLQIADRQAGDLIQIPADGSRHIAKDVLAPGGREKRAGQHAQLFQ